MKSEKLEKILSQVVDNKSIYGAVLAVESIRDNFKWVGAAGNIKIDSQYFIASTTKIYITTLLCQLEQEKKIQFEDNINKFLPQNMIEGLSPKITIKHLMAQTSGIADYFQGKPKGGKSLEDLITSNQDQKWTYEESLQLAKNIGPSFLPGKKGKALYSDTNYQLLGRIIESITGRSINENLEERIFKPLRLTRTYLYSDPSDNRPLNIYYKKQLLLIPKAMSSFAADGGIVSTASESMIFLKAFFDGDLFPKDKLKEMQLWNSIFFPLEYGVGIMRFKLPRIFSPFKPFPELIGHSGLSGAFAFYCPELEIFMSGTVNQIAKPSTSFKLMLKVLG